MDEDINKPTRPQFYWDQKESELKIRTSRSEFWRKATIDEQQQWNEDLEKRAANELRKSEQGLALPKED